ncbi:adenosylcobinamide-phosphate synthase CbiB [Amorphus sp. MBR-141]
MFLDQTTLFILLAALVIDAAVGEPAWLWRRFPHPVVVIGRIIDWLDRALNDPRLAEASRRRRGIIAIAALVMGALITGSLVQGALALLPFGWLLTAAVASVLIAQRSLYEHVVPVRDALAAGDLARARKAVSMIVGRDPARLDAPGIARAAIESTAENASDGVVAPAFWFAVLGLPGLLAYKVINTADSMIGHRSPRHLAFGWAAARLDDLVNLVPARLSGVLFALAAPVVGGRIGTAFAVMRRDAGLHRSPNAGWPEAAAAGALGIALAGPRVYASGPVDDPFLNPEGRRDPGAHDVARALRLFVAKCALLAAFCAVLSLIA